MHSIEKMIVAYRHLITFNHKVTAQMVIYNQYAKKVLKLSRESTFRYILNTDFTVITQENHPDFIDFFMWYFNAYVGRTRTPLRSAIVHQSPMETPYELTVQPSSGSLDIVMEDYPSSTPEQAEFWLLNAVHAAGHHYYVARCADEVTARRLGDWLRVLENIRHPRPLG